MDELNDLVNAARGIQPPEPESADCCEVCGREIESQRQIEKPGCQLCQNCADVVTRMRTAGI